MLWSRTGVQHERTLPARLGAALSPDWWLAASLVVLNLFDLLLTRIALERGASEVNPLFAPFVEGTAGSVVKTLGVGAVALSLLRGADRGRRPLFVALGLYGAVVAWNAVIVLVRYS